MTQPTTAECIAWLDRVQITGVNIMPKSELLADIRDKLLAADKGYEYGVRLFKIIAPQCLPFEHLSGLISQLDNYIAGQNKKIKAAEEMAKALEFYSSKNQTVLDDALLNTKLWNPAIEDRGSAADKAIAHYLAAGGK